MAVARPRPIPVTIVGGFLGAGKTTLLNHILSAQHGRRVAVLVNDFGPINIDTQLVVAVEGETISLANGCICCTIRSELLESTLELVSRPEPPEYIVVETSGVSDPAAVAATFMAPQVRPSLRVDGVVTVVDAEHARSPHVDRDLGEAQIRAADIVVLNKLDLVAPAERDRRAEWIQGIAPRARMVQTVRGQVPLELLLDLGQELPPDDPAHAGEAAAPHAPDHAVPHAPDHAVPHTHDHGASFSSCSYVTDRPLLYGKVQGVLKTLPLAVFRAKGVLALADAPDYRFTVQVVGKRVSLVPDGPWDERGARTELVFIGVAGGVDAQEIRRLFDACVAPDDGESRNGSVAAHSFTRDAE